MSENEAEPKGNIPPDQDRFPATTTGNLNKAVKRNIKRFPSDFMFQLPKEEFEKMKSDLIFQNGTSSWG
ncbi:ORF6N domain-containing protein, partial [Alistipes ihumii]|uniref:ORF6N domain-containing protein n=1 Tax=Alistipes ihumii TaxID=1470347 RepID=UPI003AB2403B